MVIVKLPEKAKSVYLKLGGLRLKGQLAQVAIQQSDLVTTA